MTVTTEQPTTETTPIDRGAAMHSLALLEIAVVNLRQALNLPGDETILNATALASLLASDEEEEDENPS